MDQPTLEEGLYHLSFSPEGHERRYFGVKHDAGRGVHEVVVLPTSVTPENPDQYGPTKVRFSLIAREPSRV